MKELMSMLSYAGAWIATAMTTGAPLWTLRYPPPTPTPTPGGTGGAGGFDWSRVKPDPGAVPNTDIFYTLTNATLYLGIVAAVCGLVSGGIAFGVGPIFGAHVVSDRGKSMMWKAGLIAIIVGCGASMIAWLIQASAVK
ncbi:hypothetical protein ACQEVZ_55660 [Dactylosporangium sp. CA-152071]|uniref:hypothetical protein n=1 Tax=Dactylosporangium sp. CA-152071 TaxID=3239933 RepID=UPI003D9180AC